MTSTGSVKGHGSSQKDFIIKKQSSNVRRRGDSIKGTKAL